MTWRCDAGHEWRAVIYARTLSGSGCPTCYAHEARARSRAGKKRARERHHAQANALVNGRLRPASAG